MKTILITGINGFLGNLLAKRLTDKHNIIGLEYSLDNLFRIEDHSFKVYSTDNINWVQLFKENTIDIIIHTATFYGRNNEDLQQIAETNLFMPFQLLDIAIKNKVSLFINTDTVLDRFVNIYALTKRQFQEWLYIRKNEIQIINMQLEHFYGRGANPSNFITYIANQFIHNAPSINLTLGEQRRDFIHIEDVVSAYCKAIQKISEIKEPFTNYQVCTNELVTIKEIVLSLKKITKSTTKLNFGALPYRDNELMISESDNSKLISLGWSPIHNIYKSLPSIFDLGK